MSTFENEYLDWLHQRVNDDGSYFFEHKNSSGSTRGFTSVDTAIQMAALTELRSIRRTLVYIGDKLDEALP